MPGVVIILGSQPSLFIFWILDPTDDSYVNWKTELKKLSMIHQRQREVTDTKADVSWILF